jgi:hypothetical protein
VWCSVTADTSELLQKPENVKELCNTTSSSLLCQNPFVILIYLTTALVVCTIYSLAPRKLKAVDEWAASYRKFWDSRLKRLGDYLDSQK